MWVYVDESGDTGFKFTSGSSRFFALSAIVFSARGAAEACSTTIDGARADLGWPTDKEFKFNKMNSDSRLHLLRAVEGHDFTTHTFVLNKGALWRGALTQRDRMYSRVVRWMIENAIAGLDGATILFDECGERRFYRMLAQQIGLVQSAHSRPNAVLRVAAHDSKQSNVLQMADVICGSAARMYSGKSDAQRYYPVVSHRQGTFRFWPP